MNDHWMFCRTIVSPPDMQKWSFTAVLNQNLHRISFESSWSLTLNQAALKLILQPTNSTLTIKHPRTLISLYSPCSFINPFQLFLTYNLFIFWLIHGQDCDDEVDMLGDYWWECQPKCSQTWSLVIKPPERLPTRLLILDYFYSSIFIWQQMLTGTHPCAGSSMIPDTSLNWFQNSTRMNDFLRGAVLYH